MNSNISYQNPNKTINNLSCEPHLHCSTQEVPNIFKTLSTTTVKDLKPFQLFTIYWINIQDKDLKIYIFIHNIYLIYLNYFVELGIQKMCVHEMYQILMELQDFIIYMAVPDVEITLL